MKKRKRDKKGREKKRRAEIREGKQKKGQRKDGERREEKRRHCVTSSAENNGKREEKYKRRTKSIGLRG